MRAMDAKGMEQRKSAPLAGILVGTQLLGWVMRFSVGETLGWSLNHSMGKTGQRKAKKQEYMMRGLERESLVCVSQQSRQHRILAQSLNYLLRFLLKFCTDAGGGH